jgi:hypothetical protein
VKIAVRLWLKKILIDHAKHRALLGVWRSLYFDVVRVKACKSHSRRVKLQALVDETDARAYYCNASEPTDAPKLFEQLTAEIGTPNLVVFTAGMRAGRSRNSMSSRLSACGASAVTVDFSSVNKQHNACYLAA